MKTVLKIVGFGVVFILLLSIQVNKKTVFNHVYDLISPATQYTQNATGELIRMSTDATTSYTKKLFDNSVPKVKDSLKSKQAALQKSGGAPLEEIPVKDKEELDQLIKSH